MEYLFSTSRTSDNIPILGRYTKSPDSGSSERTSVHHCTVDPGTAWKNSLHAGGFCGMPGGKRYTNFTDKMFPGFECFLSHNEQGEGERYKQTPELAAAALAQLPVLPVKGENLIFKRWDKLEAEDMPEVVIFFVSADILSGLFTLACFDNVAPDAVIAPFGAGCASIIYHPYREQLDGTNRAVLGSFDPSARKCMKPDLLSFAIPFNKFKSMVSQMEESS